MTAAVASTTDGQTNHISRKEDRRTQRSSSGRVRHQLAKTARRSDTWLVLSGGLAATLASISGPFVASKSFWSRLAAAVRPCGAAAELCFGRRAKLFALDRIATTRRVRRPGGRGRPMCARSRHAPGGPRSRDGEGRSARLARYGATTPWRRSAHPTSRPDRVGAIRSRARSSCLGGAPSLLVRSLRSGPPAYLLRSSLSTNSSFVFCETGLLGMDCEPRSSTAMAFSPATVNFNEYAWPVSSSRRQISIPGLVWQGNSSGSPSRF